MTSSSTAGSGEPRPGNEPPRPEEAGSEREVQFAHSRNLVALLENLNVTVLVSTYQAGKIVALGTHRGTLVQSFHNFDRPMGIAVAPDTVAVAARHQVWLLRNASDIAPQLEPPGQYSACYLTRSAQVTGEVQAHELGWSGDELWVVNTLFSCLCTPDAHYSFVPRWCPPFISELVPEDRCHLNGLAMDQGRPKYVTAMAQTDSVAGWRPHKVTRGCLLDVETGETVTEGFSMPHSPRVYRGKVWLLDSGRGSLVQVDPARGTADTITKLPGYARGLAFHDNFAVIGLSKIRETSTFDGVPIAEDRSALKCGFAVVDLRRGEAVASFEFKSGVDEIFDVAVLPHTNMAAIRGPFAASEGHPTIWTVPEEARRLPQAGRPRDG